MARIRTIKSPPNKYYWTKQQIAFIRKNWPVMTNRALAKVFGISLTLLRVKVYEMGLRRMEMEYWTGEQVEFLIKNYTKIGDVEMAELFNKKWKKNKGWTKKHIEKKRRYMKLKRSKTQIAAIKQRNVDNGRFLLCPVKRWATAGQAKDGEIRMWREQSGRYTPRIKINGRFVHWNRWKWEKHRGKIPKGMNVVFRDNNPANNRLSNLMLVTRAEHARRNLAIGSQGLSDNYLAGLMSHKNKELREQLKRRPVLLQLKRKQLLLNRTINEKILKTA